MTRGVLLDLVRLRNGPLASRSSIGRADLIVAAEAASVRIESGDAVLIRTGWQECHEGKVDISFDEEPGIDVEAALWLAEAEVAMVGADNFAIEAIPFPAGTVFPVHQRLIRDFSIPLLEGLVLQPLAEHQRGQFLFVAAPLSVVGGTGSPLAPIAVL